VERAVRSHCPPWGLSWWTWREAPAATAFGTLPVGGRTAALAVSAWNLSIAEEMGVDLVTECGSCYSSPEDGEEEASRGQSAREKVNELLVKNGQGVQGHGESEAPVRRSVQRCGARAHSAGRLSSRWTAAAQWWQYPLPHTLFPVKSWVRFTRRPSGHAASPGGGAWGPVRT
jgi:hypothetical protein